MILKHGNQQRQIQKGMTVKQRKTSARFLLSNIEIR